MTGLSLLQKHVGACSGGCDVKDAEQPEEEGGPGRPLHRPRGDRLHAPAQQETLGELTGILSGSNLLIYISLLECNVWYGTVRYGTATSTAHSAQT